MFYDIEQNTDAWLDMRAGKVTGSKIACIMANFGKGFGEPAKRYAVDIANERLRGERTVGDRYTNKHMEAGHVEEPIARALYELKTGYTVANGGFYDNGNTGCSPDGNILFECAGIEIKSVVPATHYKTLSTNKVDSAYKWQTIFNMREAKFEWLDYISFCDQFYKDRQIIIVRLDIKSFSEELDMMEKRLDEFESLVDSITKVIKGD